MDIQHSLTKSHDLFVESIAITTGQMTVSSTSTVAPAGVTTQVTTSTTTRQQPSGITTEKTTTTEITGNYTCIYRNENKMSVP